MIGWVGGAELHPYIGLVVITLSRSGGLVVTVAMTAEAELILFIYGLDISAINGDALYPGQWAGNSTTTACGMWVMAVRTLHMTVIDQIVLGRIMHTATICDGMDRKLIKFASDIFICDMTVMASKANVFLIA